MARTLTVLVVSTALLAACGFLAPFELGPEHIVVADPQGFVRDARTLIAQHKAGEPQDHEWIDDAHLPASLRIQKVVLPRGAFLASVLEAHVASDHLDLVLIRHTDGHAGARVWATGSRPHRDARTRYEDIYLFTCTTEQPESAGNIC